MVPRACVIGLTDWIACFRPAMTRPTFTRLQLLSLSWLLTDRPGTVTAALLASGLSHSQHHTLFYNALQAAWEPDDIGKVLLMALVEAFYRRDQRVRITLDDTLSHHDGPYIDAVGTHLDPVRSSKTHKTIAFGHVWVILTVLIDVPGARRAFALPVCLRLYLPKDFFEEDEPRDDGRTFQTKPELAAEILRTLTAWMPDQRFTLANDELYSCRAVAAALGENIEMVGRMRRNAALTNAPPPPGGKRGRPRKKGEKFPSLLEIYADSRWRWQQTVVRLGRREVVVRYKTLRAQQYGVFGARMLRVVVVEQQGSREDFRVYFTTADQSAPWVLRTYARRWNQEVLHRELKQELGWGKGQVLSPRSVARQAPLIAFLYTVIVAWYAQHADGQDWARGHVGPWYTHKSHPSFRDMYAAARRITITAREYSDEVDDTDFPQVFRTLAHAATHLPGKLAITEEVA